MLTPFALGTVVGAIASGRVPVGNAEGDLLTSWLNPTSTLIGILAVATSGYLAAVYLAADAHRLGERALELDFRARALYTGVCAGGIALAGLFVVHADAPAIWDGLSRGGSLLMIVVSIAAGLITLKLVWRSRFVLARVAAALAVAAIVAGWAFAQEPRFLPGLTIDEAAAGRSTLIAVVAAVAIGAVPALLLLFGLFLRGRLDTTMPPRPSPLTVPRAADGEARVLGRALGLPCLLAGAGLLVVGDSGWAHAVGVASLCAGAASVFVRLGVAPEHD